VPIEMAETGVTPNDVEQYETAMQAQDARRSYLARPTHPKAGQATEVGTLFVWNGTGAA
jgi:hypothetical protein